MVVAVARQLCYLAACVADEKGFKAARGYVGMIKVAAPRVALKIIDEAIQLHGAHGISQDSKLSDEFIHVRHVRLADGRADRRSNHHPTLLTERARSGSERRALVPRRRPDIVHLRTIAKQELTRPVSQLAKDISGTNTNIAKYGKYESMPKLPSRL